MVLMYTYLYIYLTYIIMPTQNYISLRYGKIETAIVMLCLSLPK